jgi:outer membrane lipoprotein-sorting protein
VKKEKKMNPCSLFLICGLLAFFTPYLGADDLSPEAILQRIDSNMVFQTARSEVEMVMTIGGRTLTKTLVSQSRGSEQSFIEILSPPRDKGTKILKLDGVIRIYYPSAERVMRLSGHMLRQSMMGSDFSYEDMTERAQGLTALYRVVLDGEESVQGRPCHRLVLTAREDGLTYHVRKIWVDCTLYLGLREELYARSGKLLKVLTVDEVKSFEGRHYPVKVTMEDRLRKGSKTVMRVSAIEFNVNIPPDTFSERNLLRR